MDPSLAGSLERRKQVHVRLRPDLSIEPQQYEGRTYYVVKDPVSLRYYRFRERERFLMQFMDGRHTLEDAQQEFERQHRPQRLRLEEIEGFAHLLMRAGLAYHDTPQTGQFLFEQFKEQRRFRWLGRLTNLLAIQIPVLDPDRLLDRLLGYLKWIFTGWFMLVSVSLMLAASLLVTTHFDAFRAKLPTFHEFFAWRTMANLWLALAAVKILHEFGHGLSCKAFAGEVHEMGVFLLCLSPFLYCNVSDAWTLPSKWRRILISFAGIYVELLIAALATFLWWHTPSQPFLHQLCLSLMIVCSVNTVLFNGNPLLRFDGYYMLADWLEIPNLRERASRFLKHRVLKICLGVDGPREPFMARGRRLMFVAYAVASYAYRWLVTVGILWFLYTFLKPYKLGALGVLLAGAAIASMIGWPLYGLVRNCQQRGGLPSMKPRRLLVSTGVCGAVVLALWLVPLPVSRIRQSALIQVQPEALEKVFLPAPAILERLYVRDGQRVQENDILAEFRSLELENHLEEARSEHDIRLVQLKVLQDQAEATTDSQERGRLEVMIATAASERDLFAGQVDVYDKMIKRLVLRAPRAGVVLSPPSVDEMGKWWHADAETPFCLIADTSRLRAVLPVAPADYRLLNEELSRQTELEAAIRVPGVKGRVCKGRVVRLPEAEARGVPVQLTVRGGGPLAVEPGGRAEVYVPQTQQYLVTVVFLEADGTVFPGTLAQVRVSCRWRSCTWWLWRMLASTFDLGLI
jgi:putative peptide zinc metalloprotease protein